MGRHREVRGRLSGRRVAPTRPRWNRLGAAASALGVTLVAVLGGMGLLPVDTGPAAAASLPSHSKVEPNDQPGSLALADSSPTTSTPGDRATSKVNTPTLPADSGSGRRVVFAMGEQRVWLVGAEDDAVQRTYLVSGSVSDNLKPGTYSVYSKSIDAVGIDDSGTMKYMVRFAHGPNAAIGFHDIPVLHGATVQTRDQLGTPQSHGCIRQWRPDAKALWDFAPVGTTVVVVA
jgi:L,D-transpeptidase catalytic domain